MLIVIIVFIVIENIVYRMVKTDKNEWKLYDEILNVMIILLKDKTKTV